MTLSMDADVAVVGAGPTGSYAALSMAKAGLKVLLVDRKNAGETGAQWINDVPEWMLQKAGFDELSEREIFGKNEPMMVLSPCEKAGLWMEAPAIWSVDMRSFGERLLNDFVRQPTARFLPGIQIKRALFASDGRLTTLKGSISKGSSTEAIHISAQLFVDASGLKGILRQQVPMLSSLCPPPLRQDLCSAAQEVYSIKDIDGARQFLGEKGRNPGDMIAYLGIAGGFSLLRIQVAHDFSTVAFLTGTIALPKVPSGQQLIDTFVRSKPWVGTRLFGGRRAIPLRGPYAALAASGVALIGDAASQVFAAHGSGIGIGLLAGQKLAECVNSTYQNSQDIGALKNLWGYSRSFHKSFGTLLHGADLFRRFSQTLDSEELLAFMKSGLITERIFHSALIQQNAWPSLADLLKQIIAGLRNPRLVRRTALVVARFPLISLVALHYPEYDEHWRQSIAIYERRMASLCALAPRS